MEKGRDEFPQRIKNTLVHRVGFRCSNPNCRKLTTGPNSKIDKSINIGVAAHISVASKGGKRYNPNITSDLRKNINNGIWLCQSCAKLIDSDEVKYTIRLLDTWKSIAEQLAMVELESTLKINTMQDDDDIKTIKFFSECLDRPAFQDEIKQEGMYGKFRKSY